MIGSLSLFSRLHVGSPAGYGQPQHPQVPEIRVVLPTDPDKLQLIHKLAQYVAKEGAQFEVTTLI